MKSTWPALAFLALAALIACVYVWLHIAEPEEAGADPLTPARFSEAATPTRTPPPAAPELDTDAAEGEDRPAPRLADAERVETPRKKLIDEPTGAVRGRVVLPSGTPADERLEILVFRIDAPAQALAQDTPEHELEELAGLLARAPVDADGRFEVDVPTQSDSWLALRGRYAFAREATRSSATRGDAEVRIEALLGAWVVGRIRLPRSSELSGPDLSKCDVRLQFNALRASGASRAMVRGRLREYVTRPNDELEFEFRGVDAQTDYDLRIRPETLAAHKTARFPVVAGARTVVELPLSVGGQLRGVVVDDAGQPVVGAELNARVDPEMFGQGGFRVRTATSATHGAFALEHLPASEVLVRASAAGFLETDRTFQVEDGAEVTDVRIELKRGASLAGIVEWPDGRPAAGLDVLVSFEPSALGGMSALNAMQGAEGKALTDADGRFTVRGLGKGPFAVRAAASPEGANSKSSEPSAWIARADRVQPDSLDLRLVLTAPLTLSGRVVDKRAEPIASFKVTAREQTDGPIPGLGGERRHAVATSADGRFELAGLTPGRWLVDAESEGFPRSAAIEIDIKRDAPPAPVELVLQRGGAVSGVVLDPSGAPAANAEVTLKLSIAEVLRNLRLEEDGVGTAPTARTDAQGRFRLDGLEAGQRLIVARRQDWAESDPFDAAVAAEDELTDVELRLRRGGRIVGTVYDSRGEPATGATIQIQLGSDPMLQQFVESDARGEFVAAPLSPGDWNVIHMPRQSSSSGDDPSADLMSMLSDLRMASARVVDGEDTKVVLGAPPKNPVTLLGEIRHADRPVAGALVSLIADGGAGMESMKFVQSDANGRYRTVLREPGRYVLSVQKLGDSGEQQTAAQTVTVPEVSEFRFDVVLPGGAIRGRLLDPDGAPAARARVTLFVDGPIANAFMLGENYSEIRTDEEGRYSLDWLGAGSYSVAAGGPSFGGVFGAGGAMSGRQVRSGIAVRDGQVVENVDFRLRRAGRIAGVVRSADGSPAKETTIFLRDAEGRPLERFSLVTTDAAGKFSYDGLEPGSYTVFARSTTDVSPDSEPVRVREGETSDVSLALAPGSILIVSLSSSEGDALDCSVQVLDEQGRQVNGMQSMAGIMEAFAKGQFNSKEQRVGPLPPGRYRVLVKTRDGQSATKPVTLTGQPERKLNVRL